MELITNYGILASIAWNSNDWTADPTDADLKQSKYDFVKDNQHTHESINFGHEQYPSEADGSFIGYTPMLRRLPDKKKAKNVCAVFFLSSDYQNQNRKCIVGLYGFPELGWFERKAKHRVFKKYDAGNVRSQVEDIIYFQNPVVLNNDRVAREKLLPEGKMISKQGFNYLNSDNVLHILQLAAHRNPDNVRLANLLKKFPDQMSYLNEVIDEEDFEGFLDKQNADSLDALGRLEKKMQRLRPQLKERVSTFIERGAIAAKVKVLTKHKCLVCEALGLNAIGFRKPDGIPYVETHHVDPVSHLSIGALGLANLITLCANHHRQMHFGNASLIGQTTTQFTFLIDGQKVEIRKVRL
ncbi:HNH endonuclease [Hymenobacter sp. BT635]|uniref:HNH endonuclease n=1 Tax=Hymenobacter nitidus TaxID=2880929 RepID=A0ABS8AKF3_9BACT|nr:HNH endonuclease signature motif containing protein [Hymenobacter nitidus]MCB2380437.1 HNH endonuclease [Hymenobacter nitidus]